MINSRLGHFSIINNDCQSTSKLRKWLMGNKESTFPNECTEISFSLVQQLVFVIDEAKDSLCDIIFLAW